MKVSVRRQTASRSLGCLIGCCWYLRVLLLHAARASHDALGPWSPTDGMSVSQTATVGPLMP